MGVVTVYLDKITNLIDEDKLGKSDPYVKFELEQDNLVFDKGYGKQTSTKKNNDLNPEYGETFTFPDVPTLDNMVLSVVVWDDDIGFDDKIGSCKFALEKMGLSAEPMEKSCVVDAKSGKGWFSKKAKIFVKLSYTEE